ncbi:hypothetical protein SH668x_000940 [Planctomicrobium sp. SH668]|uniref:tetratricopeptide repeat protein n=1 Tax=Planctomicrobium sp. SH668 TaxID=3448126 RepID=UPI003F5C4D0B
MLFRQSAATLALVCCASLSAAPHAHAQGPRGSTPQVIGSTGKPYGPTQAEYQYRQQYGRPSPGSNGGGMEYVNGFPGGGGGRGGHYHYPYNPFLYLDVGPYITPPPFGGGIYYPSSAYYGPYGNVNYGYQGMYGYDPTANWQQGAYYNGFQQLNPQPILADPVPLIPQSTPKEQENSFQFQTQGDIQLQQMNYLAASERYRKAIDAARDRVDPRYRLAVTLAARSRFPEACDQLKLAAKLDPTWPQRVTGLDQLFGAVNQHEKTRIKQRVAEWTLEDARDPNRLFLLGAFLYLDDDPNAATILNTATLIDGNQDYLIAFNSPRSPNVAPAAAPLIQGDPANNRPVLGQPAPGQPRMQPPLPNSPVPALGLPQPEVEPTLAIPQGQQKQPVLNNGIPPLPVPQSAPETKGTPEPPLPPPTPAEEIEGPLLPPPPK